MRFFFEVVLIYRCPESSGMPCKVLAASRLSSSFSYTSANFSLNCDSYMVMCFLLVQLVSFFLFTFLYRFFKTNCTGLST